MKVFKILGKNFLKISEIRFSKGFQGSVGKIQQ